MSLLGRLLPSFRNSLENPRVSLNDPRAWDELFGINLSDVGVRVTPQTAIGYSPLWRGINLICNVCMRMPLHVYKEPSPDRPPEIDRTHPAYYLVHWKANQFLKAADWLQVMVYHALFRGNGYSAIFRNGRGDPAELLPLSPTDTVPVIENGRLLYASKIGKEKRKLKPSEIWHLHGLSYDGLVGHDVLTVMKDELGIGIGARKYASKFYANGASTGGILMIPRSFSEQAAKQLRKDFKDYSEGLDNAFRTAVLEDGAKWIASTFNPQESQMLESRKYSIIEVANILGLPPHKLGDNSRMAYNSIEAENNALLDDSYDPWLFRIEEECNDKLLSETQKFNGSHFFGYDRRSLKKPDQKTQTEIDDTRLNGGHETLNEQRARDNLPPLPAEIGDKIRIPTNVQLVDPETGLAPAAAAAADATAGDPQPDADKPTPNSDPSEVRTRSAPSVTASAGQKIEDGGWRIEDREEFLAAQRALLQDRLDRFATTDLKELAKLEGLERQDRWIRDRSLKLDEALQPVVRAIRSAGIRIRDAGELVVEYADFLRRLIAPNIAIDIVNAAADRRDIDGDSKSIYEAWRDGFLQRAFILTA